MTLLDNWKDVITKSWVSQLTGLGAVLELALQYFGTGLPSWAIISLLVVIFGARLVAQKGLSLPAEAAE